MEKTNIFLTGFSGTGKSTVGRHLSKMLGWTFVDTDMRIEQQKGTSISNIFEEIGEKDFRKIESAIIGQVCNAQYQVVATGGGLVPIVNLSTGALEVFANHRSGPGQGDEDQSADDEGKEDALDAVQEQSAEASPLPQHGGEVATDQEKEGHAEAVDGVIGGLVEFVLMQVLRGPVGVRKIGEKPMHHDSEEHGRSPQGIEVVVAGSAAHGGILSRDEAGEQGWSSESFKGWVVAGVARVG